MIQNRAPRGIPSGGQFTANVLSEPTISLGNSSFEPGGSQPPARRSVFFDSLSADEQDDFDFNEADAADYIRTQPTEPEYQPGFRGVAEKVGDEFSDTASAIGGVAGHLVDIQRGEVPAPETEGSFVGWGQMVPKFLRRKGKSAQAAEAHEFSETPNGRRLEAEVDYRAGLSETPKPARGTDFWNGINSMDEITTPENRARAAGYLNND